MNTRIRKIRKKYQLTQDAFANKLSLTRNYISLIEKGDRTPSDRTISDICREFNVNESWLRTGNGQMESVKSPADKISINIAKLQHVDNETIIRWINTIAESNPEMLKEIEEFMKKLLGIDTWGSVFLALTSIFDIHS